MVFIYYTSFNEPLPLEKWNSLCQKLPHKDQEYVERFYKWQDRHARLFGRLLLQKGLMGIGAASDCLHFVQQNKYDRPYIEGSTDFNISHSGQYVLCALGLNTRVGIDIEKIRDVSFSDFQSYMNDGEWERINNSVSPIEEFFRWWTLKEAIIKADGRGLSALLSQIKINGNCAQLGEQKWYFNEVNIAKEYICHLACSDESQEIHPRRIRF